MGTLTGGMGAALVLEWLIELSQDAAPGREGFQAQSLYVALDIAAPLAYGTLVAGALMLIERVRRRAGEGSSD